MLVELVEKLEYIVKRGGWQYHREVLEWHLANKSRNYLKLKRMNCSGIHWRINNFKINKLEDLSDEHDWWTCRCISQTGTGVGDKL